MSKAVLIGIDGGATEAKSHQVHVSGKGARAKFSLGELQSAHRYQRIDGFTPVPVGEQIAQRNANSIEPLGTERAQGETYTDAAAATVIEIARAAGATRAMIGMGMPGLKTPDSRGINAINNGARTPDFLDRLEAKIREAGIGLDAPIARLGSDADYCGIGEQYAADGAFRKVQHAYYVGCGTGIADALKLNGELLPFDMTKEWLMKSWQIPSWLGPTFEKIASANGLMTLYANQLGNTPEALVAEQRFPQDEALASEPLARAVLTTIAATLAEIIYERLHTIFMGREEAPHRGEAYLKLNFEHPHHGTLLERVVIGQRFGFLWADKRYTKVFRRPVEEMLIAKAQAAKNQALRNHIAPGGKINKHLLVASRLREAPAIGAAIDAYRAANKK